MGRFMLCDHDELQSFLNQGVFCDPEDWMAGGHNLDFATYLVDTETGVVIFCDYMEPEDATLSRGLQPLVRYMEELTA